MLETTDNILIESLTEAFETMAFMTVMPPEDELPEPSDCVRVEMSFTGPSSGTVELMAGDDFISLLAANVMGMDTEETEAHLKGIDAFKELLNTTCGVLLPRLATAETDVFDVTVPSSESFPDDPQAWQSFVKDSAVTILDVDDNPVAVRMTDDD